MNGKTIPSDFPLSDARDKEVVIAVTVKALKETVLPELDDEFANKLVRDRGLDGLKEIIKEQLGVEKTRQIDDHKVNQIVEHFNSLVDFELPEDLVRYETQGQAQAMIQRGVQSGLSPEDLASQQDDINESAGTQARTNLKTNFILQEIARVEGITVSDQELVNHLAMIANSRKQNPKKFITELQRTGRIPGIRNSMLVGKAIDFVLEHATVEETQDQLPNTDE